MAKLSKRVAQEALQYMRDNYDNPNKCYGYAWATLARVADQPGLPLPQAPKSAPSKEQP